MPSDVSFRPSWVSAPGETIGDILQKRSISQTELARKLGITAQAVVHLLTGRQPITEVIADRLARTIGPSKHFWIERERQYRHAYKNLTSELDAFECRSWLANVPVREMIKLGWIDVGTDTLARTVACLSFFGVDSIREWYERTGEVRKSASLRTSKAFTSNHGALAAWIRRGEIESTSINCRRWSRSGLESRLPQIRTLTRTYNPDIFLPELQKLCGEVGVAVVVLPAPEGCRASGATRVLPKGLRLVMLSFRHLTEDHFWFSLFHELGHVLLHKDIPTFVDGEYDANSKEEQEANDFAANVLIPPEFKEELLRLPVDRTKIIRFAKKIGVSPGIIVGQLQHAKLLGHGQMNGLKRRFTWSEESATP